MASPVQDPEPVDEIRAAVAAPQGGNPDDAHWDANWDEPAWVFDAAAERDRADLAAAASDSFDPRGMVVRNGLEALLRLDHEALARAGDAAALLDGVVATARLVGSLQAMGQRLLAALARPGVAVPLEQLVASSMSAADRRDQSLRVPDELPENLPVGPGGHLDLTPLLAHPLWKTALEAEASRLAATEVGCALRIAPVTARLRTEAAVTMVDQLPCTLAAQQAGEVDGYRASIIAEESATLDVADRRIVEARVLPHAAALGPALLRDLVKRECIAIDAESAARRARRAKARRNIRVAKADDDMAVFTAFLGAPEAELGFGLLDGIAHTLATSGLAEGRSIPQLRADALVDIFTRLATTGSVRLDTADTAEVTDLSSGRCTAPNSVCGAGASSRQGAGASDDRAASLRACA